MNTINVNLKPCICSAGRLNAARRCGNPNPVDLLPCDTGCPAHLILIPCPIPRTVEMTVRLGEQEATAVVWERESGDDSAPHLRGAEGWTRCGTAIPDFGRPRDVPMKDLEAHLCRRCDRLRGVDASYGTARPIRVTCTIGGETWAGSTVVDVDNPDDHQGRWGAGSGDTYRSAIAACRARWEIIVALVTGKPLSLIPGIPRGSLPLVEQRDAVFAALAKMATLEHEHEAARLTLPASCRPIPPTGSDTPRPSVDALRLYVSRLIAKVSAL